MFTSRVYWNGENRYVWEVRFRDVILDSGPAICFEDAKRFADLRIAEIVSHDPIGEGFDVPRVAYYLEG